MGKIIPGKARITLPVSFCWLFLLNACAKPAPKEPIDVAVQLKWFRQAQFAGFYVAEQKGYFSDEGLRALFVEGGPTVDDES